MGEPPRDLELARFGIEDRAASDLVIAVLERWAASDHHCRKSRLPFRKRQAGQILALELDTLPPTSDNRHRTTYMVTLRPRRYLGLLRSPCSC